MSSHREAPAISKDAVADSTDLYAFVSPDDPNTVTIIANYLPGEAPFGGPNFQTNLIMPHPTTFLSSKLPACSIIRPTNTKGAATGVAKFLTDMGLFKGQSAAFFAALTTLARQADAARRG